jgi:hypothetical protein
VNRQKMKAKVINIKNNADFVKKIQKIVDDKAFVQRKIKEGKFKEIKSDIKFAHPL